MDKYLLIIMILLIIGMAFSVFKDLENPNLVLFYAQLAGIIIIIAYTNIKHRRKSKDEKKN